MHFFKIFGSLIFIAIFFIAYSYWTLKLKTHQPLLTRLRCRVQGVDIDKCKVEKKCLKVPKLRCKKQLDLIRVQSYVNESKSLVIKKFTDLEITCCFMVAQRNESSQQPDKIYKLSKCKNFENELLMSEEYYIIQCLNKSKLIYSKGFVSLENNLNMLNKKNVGQETRPMKIILIGIDGVSTAQFQRTLPKLEKYLQRNQWVKFTAYNKVGENTFPNLMALLTGYNLSTSYKLCISNQKLDNCPFIWKRFSNNGFLTAYFEDNPEINTFNYQKPGFRKQPTDFYGQNYLLALENMLPLLKKDGIVFCIGDEYSAQIVLDNSKRFALESGNYSTFGFFWINGIAHSNSNYLYDFENNFLKYFKNLRTLNISDESIIIFLSDHGDRFGPLRSSSSGYVEERLPFLYLSLPNWFREQYPQYYHNVLYNKDILSTPYDIYMTLQHLLNLYNKSEMIEMSSGCPKCHSLLDKLDEFRTCSDCGIDDNWCTCSELQKIDMNETNVTVTVQNVIDYMNRQIQGYIDNEKCGQLKLFKILDVFHLKSSLVIKFITKPGKAIFETSLLMDAGNCIENDVFTDKNFKIARITAHFYHSQCIANEPEKYKMFCYCLK